MTSVALAWGRGGKPFTVLSPEDALKSYRHIVVDSEEELYYLDAVALMLGLRIEIFLGGNHPIVVYARIIES